MELPDDVLVIVREYSRPCFKYFREYKSTLRLCGFHEWSSLLHALKVNPERVLPAIRAHEKTQTLWLQAYHENMDHEEKIRQGYYEKQDARKETYLHLVKTIHSIPNILEPQKLNCDHSHSL